MFRNYFKIAYRQLLKHKLFSALNIFGLATSMSVCLLLIMILADQYGYDEFHKNKDRLFRVTSARAEPSIPLTQPTLATTSLELKNYLQEGYPFVSSTTRLAQTGGVFRKDNQPMYADNVGYYVDASFLDMFSFGWTAGNAATALTQPYSIVLTQEAADKFFPEGNALGQVLNFDELGAFTITGLMPDPPIRSHIYFDYLISWATVTAMQEAERRDRHIYDETNISRGLVYILLEEDADRTQLDEALAAQSAAYSERSSGQQYRFFSQAMLDVMPSPGMGTIGNEIGTGTPSIVLYFLMTLGFIIMLAACFNYMNLSVARSLRRSKEIGIRKVIGAGRKDVIFQLLSEAVLIAFLSLLVAVALLEFLIPAFYGLDPFVRQIFYLERTPQLYLLFFVFSLVIGLFAGLFPAINISTFRPIEAIQQLSNAKLFSKVGLRKALVTAQFALSLIFILVVIIVLR
ncbi:MAG: ABC transporter permease, partial [Bacteroidota bacterium]